MSALKHRLVKQQLAGAGVRHHELAARLGISRPALSSYLNHGVLPNRYDRGTVERQINAVLRQAGREARPGQKKAPPRSSAVAPSSQRYTHITAPEEDAMLLRKSTLTQAARRAFGLHRDPFADPTCREDVFLSPDLRYVRESMYQVARHGGFIGVIGESGSGKSTLREELIDRLQRDDQAVIVIQPYVLAMEGTDSKGKTLKAQHIAEAIMASVAPLAALRNSPEARFRQLHDALRESARAGHSHVLIIEEAHCLPIPTLKHLKRFRELKDGLRPLLSVILIGQTELAIKLSEHNPEVREVVQRIELITLPPLDNDLQAYVEHRMARAGTSAAGVLAKDALDALRVKLSPTRTNGTLLYPLAVHNALTAALNAAAELGLPQVTADLVRGC